jgi:epoxyqueuosine reductase QueG
MERTSIIKEIACFMKNYSEQTSIKTRWKKPLVGFASANDPLFLKLKEIVSPNHALPQDLLPTCKTAVVYFIPFEDIIEESNAKEELFPSLSWAVAYIETNHLIKDLGIHIKNLFESAGYQSMSTQATHNYSQEILLSDWSHRHVGYIAGLGRFGLNRWLITKSGCCGRMGSLVTEAFLSPTPRPTKEFCLHFAGYECSVCVDKCNFGALFLDRFDRHACNRQLLKNDAYFSDLETSDVCGKCGCGLPCSTTNPVARKEGWMALSHF